MAKKITIEWKTQVTETYLTEVDLDDFLKVAREHYGDDAVDLADLDEVVKGGSTYVPGWSDLGAQFEVDPPESAEVYEREIESIQITED